MLLGPRFGSGVALGVSLLIRVVNIAGELLAVLLVHGVCAIGAVWKREGRSESFGSVGASPSAS